jgi:hypothetical protein
MRHNLPLGSKQGEQDEDYSCKSDAKGSEHNISIAAGRKAGPLAAIYFFGVSFTPGAGNL